MRRIAAVIRSMCAVASLVRAIAAAEPNESISSPGKTAVDALIPWLLNDQEALHGIAFGDVITASTGKQVRALDLKDEADQRVVKQLRASLDEVVRRMNQPNAAIQSIARINEVSSHFEDMIRDLMNSAPGFACDFPKTAEDKVQRTGYPDLRLVDRATQRVYYLDPKLYAVGSRESSFRTFYFEPKVATNKVRDDAVHLILGFEHEPRKAGSWKFTRWDIVDLAHFKVKLKAEFQGSNRDMYRPDAIVATSAQE